MKQTKPFGTAYLPVSSDASEAALPNPLQSIPSEGAQTNQKGASEADIFVMSTLDIKVSKETSLPEWQKMIKKVLIALTGTISFFAVYIGMRDSMMLASMLDQVTTEETVIVCKDGMVYYPDFSITDRLMNRGRLVCTDWQVQRGYLSPPKR